MGRLIGEHQDCPVQLKQIQKRVHDRRLITHLATSGDLDRTFNPTNTNKKVQTRRQISANYSQIIVMFLIIINSTILLKHEQTAEFHIGSIVHGLYKLINQANKKQLFVKIHIGSIVHDLYKLVNQANKNQQVVCCLQILHVKFDHIFAQFCTCLHAYNTIL